MSWIPLKPELSQPSWLMKSDYCNFKIKDSGLWYMIDANHTDPELYDEVPDSIVIRAGKAMKTVHEEFGSDIYVDRAPYFKEALEREFEEVEFMGTDFIPGAIY